MFLNSWYTCKNERLQTLDVQHRAPKKKKDNVNPRESNRRQHAIGLSYITKLSEQLGRTFKYYDISVYSPFHVKSITQNITRLHLWWNLVQLLIHVTISKYKIKYKSRSSIMEDIGHSVTLLLIKLEKQTIYHWKANKHAHITHK